MNRGQHRPAHGQRSGLVENDRVQVGKPFQRFPSLEKHAELRASAHGNGKRGGYGQPHGAGASDDQHGNGSGERQRKRMSGDEPGHKRQRAKPRTTGTKMELARSASRSMGARELCACSTMRVICASTVASPSDSARQTTAPS